MPARVWEASLAEVFSPLKQSEASFQRQVVQFAQIMGWHFCYHTHDSRGSQRGFPDLVLVRRPRVVWAELKAGRRQPTEDQWAWIEELRACGQEVYVWRPSTSWPEIERVLR